MMKIKIFFFCLLLNSTNAAWAAPNFAQFALSLSKCLESQDQRCIMQFVQKDSLTARGKFRCRKEETYNFNQRELIRCLEKENGELKSGIDSCLQAAKKTPEPSSPYFVAATASATTCIFQHFEGKWTLGQILLRDE